MAGKSGGVVQKTNTPRIFGRWGRGREKYSMGIDVYTNFSTSQVLVFHNFTKSYPQFPQSFPQGVGVGY